jgi:hypothetical protein
MALKQFKTEKVMEFIAWKDKSWRTGFTQRVICIAEVENYGRIS